MQYRRLIIPGTSYFFTVVLQDRRSDLLIRKINESVALSHPAFLRRAFSPTPLKAPFAEPIPVWIQSQMH